MSKTKTPKISIIIPVYNVEKYLNKCVQSAIDQTYKNVEVILVDDGSSDNCPKMCDDFAKKNKNIKVFHKANGGLSDARNVGIEKSSGDYLMFLDSDDYLDKNICKVLINLSLENNAEISMCDANVIYDNNYKGEIFDNKPINNKPITSVYFKHQLLEMLLKSPIKYFMTSWAKLYKKELFNELRFDYGKIHEDEFILHKLINITNKLVHINLPYYNYLQRQGSIMQSKKEKSYIHFLEAFEQRFSFLINNTALKEQTIQHALTFFKNSFTDIKLAKLSKEVAKKYHDAFKKYYKLANNKTFAMFALYHFPNSFIFLYKTLKNKKK